MTCLIQVHLEGESALQLLPNIKVLNFKICPFKGAILQSVNSSNDKSALKMTCFVLLTALQTTTVEINLL